MVALELNLHGARKAAQAAWSAVECACEAGKRAAAAILPVAADGTYGYSALAPYDAIHVGGSHPEIPAALKSQLRRGGRLLLCVGEADEPQCLTLVERIDQDGLDDCEMEFKCTIINRGSMMYGLKPIST